jgi:hypothetical protein
MYDQMARYHGYQASKEEAAKFFPEYAAKFPDDARVIDSWLARIVRDKEPLDKGAELVARLEELTRDNPIPDINADIAISTFSRGDKAKPMKSTERTSWKAKSAALRSTW